MFNYAIAFSLHCPFNTIKHHTHTRLTQENFCRHLLFDKVVPKTEAEITFGA